ncbi:DHH family phosphoesterase [Chitinivibrio alkaliphilus]|uniref:Phosphoesterase RecJ domain-containing protein n=1 Tax=Chitinivibrio alkaliphilus ACht1 TaxID=1313304 RepID=U7DCI4_9BACT|nr:bifunctional oligoribonuclease/PAP phosphatase NrnA [Chitinivibrio alkaliphilus]ERP32145.1 phosphoesterase RecJ domain-containing protein [Chitinivibrio alkaliphilus ACht1]
MTWNNLVSLIEKNSRFCITSHVSQDADNIGSQLAMYWLLRDYFKKEVVLYNTDPVPKKFLFLSEAADIESTLPEESFDTLVVLDSSNLSRLSWENVTTTYTSCINIDHHRDNSHFGTVNIVDETAAATCQILTQLFEGAGLSYPSWVANALYAGILADTGGFQFENTSPTLLRDAALLLERGADGVSIYRGLFAAHSIQALRLRAEVWSTLEFYENGRIAVMTVDEKRIDELGADRGDTEGMADIAKNTRGVEVGILIKQKKDHIHFSFRSQGAIDIGAVAATVPGGGGHCCAAGCSFTQTPLDEAKSCMIERIAGVLRG